MVNDVNNIKNAIHVNGMDMTVGEVIALAARAARSSKVVGVAEETKKYYDRLNAPFVKQILGS